MSSPLPFTDFARDISGIRLTTGQSALSKVAFDGLEPRDLTGEEAEIGHEIWGDVAEVSPDARRVVALVCGARSGKSTLLGCRSLHCALTVPVVTRPGERAYSLLLSSDIRYARADLRAISGMVGEHRDLKRLIVSETADALVLRRPQDGVEVELAGLPSAEAGRSIRGRQILSISVDEASFISAGLGSLLGAALPRLVPGAQAMIASTPYVQGEPLHEIFDKNFGRPDTALVAHAPTWLMRSGDEAISKMLAFELKRDPANYAREFGATWISANGSYLDIEAIERAIDHDRPLVLERDPQSVVAIGFDAAMSRDQFAIVVVQQFEEFAEVLRVEVRSPKPGMPLVPSECWQLVIDVAKAYRCTTTYCDGYMLPAVTEALAREGIAVVAVGQSASSKLALYTRLRDRLHTGRISLPPSGPLADEMRRLVATPRAGGGLTIEVPRGGGKGSHGDALSAFVAALHGLESNSSASSLWQSFEDINKQLRAVNAGGHWGRSSEQESYLGLRDNRIVRR